MREVLLPDVAREAEPGGSANCPSRRLADRVRPIGPGRCDRSSGQWPASRVPDDMRSHDLAPVVWLLDEVEDEARTTW
jgi:hypothetical protein